MDDPWFLFKQCVVFLSKTCRYISSHRVHLDTFCMIVVEIVGACPSVFLSSNKLMIKVYLTCNSS